MPLSPSSLGQDQLLFPLQPLPSFQSGKVLSTFFFFKGTGWIQVYKKGAIYSKPCPSSSLSEYFTASFPFPIKKEKVWQTRLDTGRGNRGLLHHPRQIMPPIMQATHSHCRLHANDGVISPSLEHKRALTLFAQQRLCKSANLYPTEGNQGRTLREHLKFIPKEGFFAVGNSPSHLQASRLGFPIESLGPPRTCHHHGAARTGPLRFTGSLLSWASSSYCSPELRR